MLSQKAKDLFARLEMEYPAVAVKYCYAMPENTAHTDKTLSFCELVKESQITGKKFFITSRLKGLTRPGITRDHREFISPVERTTK